MLYHTRYQANKGGHAPGHFREAFLRHLEKVSLLDEDEPIPEYVEVGYEENERPLKWLLGHLWDCTDILPGDACLLLGMSRGSTYAQAVRKIAAGEPPWD